MQRASNRCAEAPPSRLAGEAASSTMGGNPPIGKDAAHAHHRMPPVGPRRIPRHGQGSRVHRRQHVPVLHEKPARRRAEGARPARHRRVRGLCARARHRGDPRIRPLHGEPGQRQAGRARFHDDGAGRRPCAHGRDAAGDVHAAARQRAWEAGGRSAGEGCRSAERRDHAVAGDVRARADHGGRGHAGGQHVRAGGEHPRPSGARRPRGRALRRVPRVGRRLRHRRRPGRRGG